MLSKKDQSRDPLLTTYLFRLSLHFELITFRFPVQFPEGRQEGQQYNQLWADYDCYYCSRFDFLFDWNHLRVLPTNTMNVSTKNRTDVMSRATIVEPSMSEPSRMCCSGSRRLSASTAVPFAGGHVVETIIS